MALVWQQPLPEIYTQLSDPELRLRIAAARETLGSRLLILGHHYQQDAIIDFADFTGDSFELSRKAADQQGIEYVIFQGSRADFPIGYAAHFAVIDPTTRGFTFDQDFAVARAVSYGGEGGFDVRLEAIVGELPQCHRGFSLANPYFPFENLRSPGSLVKLGTCRFARRRERPCSIRTRPWPNWPRCWKIPRCP